MHVIRPLTLAQRLVDDPPPSESDELSTLLDSLSRSYATVFFKPLFLSAVSTKEFTVINHLCTITVYSKYVEDFWIRDPEMLSMALLSDTGSVKATVSHDVQWAIARIGQSVLMVEFIHRLQDLRRWKESASVCTSRTVSTLSADHHISIRTRRSYR